MSDADVKPLGEEVAALRSRLDEAEQTLHAIRAGEVDALVVGNAVYTLDSANAALNRVRGDVLAQMKDAVMAVDLEDRLIYINPAAEQQYGTLASEALGYPLSKIYRPHWYADGHRVAAMAALRDSGSWRGELLHVLARGDELHVEITVSALHDAEDGVTGRLIVSRDVSERYRAAAALREAMTQLEQRQLEFSTLVENTPFVFARFDRDLRHTYVSPVIEQYSGRKPVEFIGRRHEETGVPALLAQEWDEQLRHVFATGRMHTGRFSFNNPEGVVRHFDFRLIAERNSAGAIDSVLSIAIDVTEREAADAERRAAEASLREADRRKDVFLATLAHELRNPMAPIGNSLQIMRLSPDPHAHAAARSVIERQLQQLMHMVEDLLDVSRISTGKVHLRKTKIDLATVVRDAVESSRPLIDAGHHQLIIDNTLPTGAVIDADPTRLTQVVANLLNNAAKYTPAGGRIEVSTSLEGACACIRVADTGIGIDAERLPELFQMFAQIEDASGRAQGGLGIGLALVRHLVELHGGSVDITSAGLGQGSCVEVRLPAQVEASVAPAESPLEELPPGGGLQVLVVDDNHDSADSMAELLGLLGFDTVVAYDGVEGLSRAAELRPQVAILDLGMPLMGGLELAQRLRAADWGRDMLLIALSGWGRDDDRRQTAEAGFDHHFVKPVNLNTLAQVIAAPLHTVR
ncbi:MAG: ATP-binding protein [Rubrivivax sp.]